MHLCRFLTRVEVKVDDASLQAAILNTWKNVCKLSMKNNERQKPVNTQGRVMQ